MNTRIMRIVVLTLIAVLLLFAVMPMFQSNEYRGKEIVESETTSCVVETCITDSTLGKECIEIKPKLSKIRIIVDENGYKHVHIEPTAIECR